MAADAGIYVGIALGAIVLLGVSVAIIYHQHRKEVTKIQALAEAHAQVVQGRMQQVLDQNLPPFYIDHERDPVCVYEHELPPDVVPPEQPIVVHSTTDDDSHIISPDEDPLVASPSPLASRNGNPSSFPFPTMSEGSPADNAEGVQSSSTSTHSNRPLDLEQSGSRSLSSPAPAILTPTSSRAASPRVIDHQMLTLARLPAPPSYDVPNRVVDRSPFMHPHHRHPHQLHSHSYSTSDVTQFMTPPPAAAASQVHVGSTRARSHTISHTASDEAARSHGPTPRYSIEFPSHIPHHLHFAEYQRARALYDMSRNQESSLSLPSSPASSPLSRFNTNGSAPARPHMLSMQDRSHSDVQPYGHPSSIGSPSSSSSALSGPQRQRNGQRILGSRPRASTVGESSKLLIQRMQHLWKRTGSPTLQTPMGSGQSSLNVSSLNVAEAMDMTVMTTSTVGNADVGSSSTRPSPEVEHDLTRMDSSSQPEHQELGHGNEVAIASHSNGEPNVPSGPSSSLTEVVSLDRFSSTERSENNQWDQTEVSEANLNNFSTSTPTEIISPIPFQSSTSILLAVS